MIVHLKNKYIAASINLLGAELTSLTKDDKNYIWEIDQKYWNKTSPILFPIVGQLKNDSYVFKGDKYKLSRHGFARDNEFEIKKISESSVTLSLKENKETLLKYPFQFELNVCYTIVKQELVIEYFVKNNSSTLMPFSLGAHPAFALTSNLENFSLCFENDTFLENHMLINGFFSGKIEKLSLKNNLLNLNYNKFANDALVLKTLESSTVIMSENSKPFLKIKLGNFPYLGIWTKNKAPFLCIEPWFGYADNENSSGNILTKEGIQILKTNSTFKASFTIEIL